MHTLFTIGHSNRSAEEFVQLLIKFKVQAIADVRSHPKSRFNPHFDKNSLAAELKSSSIAYVFLGRELGARRSERECYINGSVDYDLVEKTAAFTNGLTRLRSGLEKMTIALMCAERDPLTCHRTILVARALKTIVPDIFHIIGENEFETHAEAEIRLLREYRITGSDLFISSDELLTNAYRKRGQEIAYTEESES